MIALNAEAQFDPELAMAFRERWTLPRRAMAVAVFRDAIERGELRREIDPETAIDLLYAPLHCRLQMGTGDLSEEAIEGLFQHGMKGLGKKRKDSAMDQDGHASMASDETSRNSSWVAPLAD